jgi:hypothetical protein
VPKVDERAHYQAGIAEAKFAAADKSFEQYLNSVKILERPQPLMGITGGVRPLEKWPHVMEMAAALEESQKIADLKARQVGGSWLFGGARASWLLRFRPGSLIGLFSKGETEAKALKAKVKFVYQNLPDSWRLPLEVDSQLEMVIDFGQGVKSQIIVFPSTEDAGRGYDFTYVLMDEADSHPYLDLNFLALSGSIDSTGGQMVLLSTVHPTKVESVFQELYLGAPQNGWTKMFHGWRSRPGRDEEWYARAKRAVPETATLNPELYMLKEYPETEEEALAPQQGKAHFDLKVLKVMEQHCREPIVREGPMGIYVKYQLGRRYGCGSDTSHGTGGDYSVSVVMDLQSGAVVADVMSNEISTDEFAEWTIKMLHLYRDPIWGIEDNDWGISVIKAAEKARYHRLYGTTTHKGREVGWHTDRKSRRIMWGELRTQIDSGKFTIYNIAGLRQFFTVMLNDDKDGKPEAKQGAHDDYPTACAIALQMEGYASGVSGKVVTVASRFGEL